MNLTQWKNTTLKNYQAKYKPPKEEVKHVLDYLKANPGQKLARASYPQVKIKSEAWTKTINKKNKGLKEAGKVQVFKSFDNGFQFVHLLDQTAKDWEGMHMGHCVASYTRSKGIYSLRDKDSLPHATLEVQGNRIVQLSGKGNGKVRPEYIDMLGQSISKFSCSPQILSRHFIPISSDLVAFLKKHYEPISFLKEGVHYYSTGRIHTKLKTPFKVIPTFLIDELQSHAIPCFETLCLLLKLDPTCFNRSNHYRYPASFTVSEQIKALDINKVTDPTLLSNLKLNLLSPKFSEFITSHFTLPTGKIHPTYLSTTAALYATKPLTEAHLEFLPELLNIEHLIPAKAFEYLVPFVKGNMRLNLLIQIGINKQAASLVEKAIKAASVIPEGNWSTYFESACAKQNFNVFKIIFKHYQPNELIMASLLTKYKAADEWFKLVESQKKDS